MGSFYQPNQGQDKIPGGMQGILPQFDVSRNTDWSRVNAGRYDQTGHPAGDMNTAIRNATTTTFQPRSMQPTAQPTARVQPRLLGGSRSFADRLPSPGGMGGLLSRWW